MKNNIFILSVCLILLISCQETPKHRPGEYLVHKTATPINVVTQKIDLNWEQAPAVTQFIYPWRTEEVPFTSFKALWDDRYFYFLFQVEDAEIITQIDSSLSDEMQAVNSDRVEIFFKADDQMDPYYSLEMDALGRVLDTEGHNYRKVDFDWDWPQGELSVTSFTEKKGYVVQGSISLLSLRRLGMLREDMILQAGLYRGEYISKGQHETSVKWISWIKPDSKKPDFHIPSSFGLLHLIQKESFGFWSN